MALLTDGSDDFIDKEYADFTSEMWADGHSFFCYLSDSPDSLSSCCFDKNQPVTFRLGENEIRTECTFEYLYEKYGDRIIEVPYKNTWVKAKAVQLENRPMYHISFETNLENGMETLYGLKRGIGVTDNHIHLTERGEVRTDELVVGDKLSYYVYDSDNNACETYAIIAAIEKYDYDDKVYCVECVNQDSPYFTLPNGLNTHNCRLRNSLKINEEDDEHNHTTHQYSMGTASVATGSKSVMTMNLPRIIQNAARRYFSDRGIEIVDGKNISESGIKDYDKDELYRYISDEVREMTEKIHKYQTAFNEIMKDFLNANMLDVYNAGFINMRKQYLTIGVNGITDAAEFLGIKVGVNDGYKEFVNNILETINISNRKDRTRDCMFNTEFVPAENLAVKNYNWDKADGYWVSPDRNLYSSYFYNPEDTSLTVIDKMQLHGRDLVKYLDGGVALHGNLQEHLSKDQYRMLLKAAAKYGCSYFTWNVRNTVCNECGYISKHTLDECPHCHSKNLDYLTRVIGYLKRISSFSEARQEEAGIRHYE